MRGTLVRHWTVNILSHYTRPVKGFISMQIHLAALRYAIANTEEVTTISSTAHSFSKSQPTLVLFNVYL